MITRRRPLRRLSEGRSFSSLRNRPSFISEKKSEPVTPASVLHEQFQNEVAELTADKNISASRKKMINEVMKNEENHFKALLETVTYGDIGTTVTYAIPVVKKMLAELILPNIVDTQTLDMPQGFIRFLKPKKTISKGVDTAAEELPKNQIIQPKDGTIASGSDKNTYSPYYSAGIQSVALAFNIEDITTSIISNRAGTNNTVDFEQSGFNRDLFPAAGDYAVSAVLSYDETNGVWAEEATGTTTVTGFYRKGAAATDDRIWVFLPQITQTTGGAGSDAWLYGTFAGGTAGAWYIVESNSSTTARTVDSHANGSHFSLNILLPYELEDGADIFSGVEFDITFLPIYTTPRYLNATLTAYSMLAGQKMGINADQELLDYNAAAMAVEIDRWGISQLRKAALIDSDVAMRTYDATAATPTGGIYTGVENYYSHILRTLIAQRNDIYKTAFRGKGNFMVTSTEVSAIFETLNKLEPVNMEGDKIAYAGKLAGMWETYVDPYYVENEILMGYASGKNDMKAGAVYAPFIPMYLTPPDYKGDQFTFVYGVISSAGFRVYDSDNYGVTTVTL